MSRILLVARLILADVRRHPGQAAILLVAITVATTMLALGKSLGGATETLYQQTRQATAGPDLVAVAGDARTAASTLQSLSQASGVVAHHGPYRQLYGEVTANGSSVHAVMEEADATPGSVNHPLVTSGTWVRSGGVVVERGFAAALGVHVGDRVTLAGRSLPIVGTAVSAAHPVYPWAEVSDGGTTDYSGLIWLSERDARTLPSDRLSVTYALDLKLRDPDATETFMNSHRGPTTPATFFSWQFMANQDSVMLEDSQPILVIGGWLLSFLAITGVAALAAGRAAKQTRRVGLLKAVGATPGFTAAVLLAEYVTLALIADVLGLIAARLVAPSIINPTAGLITTSSGPTGGTIALTTVVALAVAALTTIGPTVRALRTETVAALADSVHRPQRRVRLTGFSAMLPTSLLLGLRLIARRPGRAVLHACSITATMIAGTALLMLFAQPEQGYGLGSSGLSNLRADQGREVLLMVTAALITLAAVNTITITWSTALEARPTMAIARTLGATPGQITAGLSAAQLLPTVPGAVIGTPLGIGLYMVFSVGTMTMPPAWWLLAIVFAPVPATAILTAIPARFAARRSVAQTLSAEMA